jgi:hypothetical protein
MNTFAAALSLTLLCRLRHAGARRATPAFRVGWTGMADKLDASAKEVPAT